MFKFRALKADEIECRVSRITESKKVDKNGEVKEKVGVVLLLYKDARCDMNVLDETVGPMNWKKSYQLIDGQLFCTVDIWDDEKKQWISKQDVGVESNTEAEKGRASDAQKRAATAWGIGRELYGAPFIWIPKERCDRLEQGNDKKWRCFDTFSVRLIEYDDAGNITQLAIENAKHVIVYTYPAEGKR